MTALTVLYVGNAFYQVRLASTLYGYLTRGTSHQETRYLMGGPTEPRTGQDAAASWLYVQGSARTVVGFDAGGVARVTCTDTQPNESSCPETLGFRLTSPEPDIWYRLGAPSRQVFVGDVKRIDYDELGLSFELKRMSVTAISFHARDDRTAFIGRAVRALVP